MTNPFDLSAPVAQLASATGNPVPSDGPAPTPTLSTYLDLNSIPEYVPTPGKAVPNPTKAPTVTAATVTPWVTYLKWVLVLLAIAVAYQLAMRFGPGRKKGQGRVR